MLRMLGFCVVDSLKDGDGVAKLGRWSPFLGCNERLTTSTWGGRWGTGATCRGEVRRLVEAFFKRQ